MMIGPSVMDGPMFIVFQFLGDLRLRYIQKDRVSRKRWDDMREEILLPEYHGGYVHLGMESNAARLPDFAVEHQPDAGIGVQHSILSLF